MSTTLKDIDISNDWTDIVAKAVAQDATVDTSDVTVCATGAKLKIHYGDSFPNNDDGEPVNLWEKVVVLNEPKIWVKTVLRGQRSKVHLAIGSSDA